MRAFMKGLGFLAIPLLVVSLGGVAESQDWPGKGRPGEGATLYNSCVPCHGLQGRGIAGKAEKDLMTKFKHYQSGTFSDAKVMRMQEVLKPMTDQQLLDLAAYITKM